MPTNRTATQRPRRKPVPEEAITAFRLARQIIDHNEEEARHAELVEASLTVNRQLRRKPWEFDIIWADNPFAPDWMEHWMKRQDYLKAHDIFCALEKLAAEQALRRR